MEETIKVLEKRRRYEELLAEGYEAVNLYMKALEHWTNVAHLDYVISILKKRNEL